MSCSSDVIIIAVNMQKFYKRIHDDPDFYMENFLKIRTKAGEMVNFKLNPMQRKSEELINKYQTSLGKPIRVIWLKARQHGISTYCEGRIFHATANNPFRNGMIISHEDKSTQNLFSMSKLFYEELPPALRPMKKYSNESALTFENPTNNDDEKYKNPGLRSKITVATAKNVDTGRSSTVHSLHCSEVAFWDNPEVLMTGIMQCIPDTPNSMVFIESTANGVGGWFYDFWKKSERGETDYLPIFLGWQENPEYSKEFTSKAEKRAFIESVLVVSQDDKGEEVLTEEHQLLKAHKLTWEQLNWRRWCIANKLNGDVDKFHQEYPTTPDEAFIASGRPQFSITALKKYMENVKPPIKTGYLEDSHKFIDDAKGYIKIWRIPEPGKFYCIGADVAEGLATGDYSAGVVLDEDFRLCATWHGHIDPDMFGEELVKLANFYNEAYLGVESNNHGGSTLRSIVKKEYWNLYFQKSYSKISESISQKMGWNTNVRTKPLMINTLTSYIRDMWLELPWDIMLSECFTYVKGEDGITTNAQSGCNDDTVMALAIALQLLLEGRDESYEPEIPNESKYINDPLESAQVGEEFAGNSIDTQEKEEYTQ